MFTHEYDSPFARKIAELNRDSHPDLCEMEDLCDFFPSFLTTFVYGESEAHESFEKARMDLNDLLTSTKSTKLQFVEGVLAIIFAYVEGQSLHYVERSSDPMGDLEPYPFPEFLNNSGADFSENSIRVLEESYGRTDLPSAKGMDARVRILKTLMFDAYRIFNRLMVVHQDPQPLVLSADLMRYYLPSLDILGERYRTVLSKIGDRDVEHDSDVVLHESRNHLLSFVTRALFAALIKSKVQELQLHHPSVGVDRFRLGNIFVNHVKREADFVRGEKAFFELGNTRARYVLVLSEGDTAQEERQRALPNATVLPYDTDPLLLAATANMEYAIRKTVATNFVYYGEPASSALFETGIIRSIMEGRKTDALLLQVREYYGYLGSDYLYVNGKQQLGELSRASSEDDSDFVRIWTDAWELTPRARELLRGKRYRGVAALRPSVTVYCLHIRSEGNIARIHFQVPTVSGNTATTKLRGVIRNMHFNEAVGDSSGVLLHNLSGVKGSIIRGILSHPTPTDLLREILGDAASGLSVSEESCALETKVESYTIRFEVRSDDTAEARVFEGDNELQSLRREGKSFALNPLFLTTAPHPIRAYHGLDRTGTESDDTLPSALTLSPSDMEDGNLVDVAVHQYARWTMNRGDAKWNEIAALFDLERNSLKDVSDEAQSIYERELVRSLSSFEYRESSRGFYRDMGTWSSYTGYAPTFILSEHLKKKEGALDYLMQAYEANMISETSAD